MEWKVNEAITQDITDLIYPAANVQQCEEVPQAREEEEEEDGALAFRLNSCP